MPRVVRMEDKLLNQVSLASDEFSLLTFPEQTAQTAPGNSGCDLQRSLHKHLSKSNSRMPEKSTTGSCWTQLV
ncbi:hypothetical protein XENOCAPTIV_026830 [Xenoophorus captivus]|uniref:Uncharacterized protein n=1 Tax=Xenoophorus captivus TaxID=1517983 RepID=A0ABV0QKE5_9TELE